MTERSSAQEAGDTAKKAAPMAAFVTVLLSAMRILGHEAELARFEAEAAKRDAVIALVALVAGLLFIIIGLNILAGAAVVALAKAGLGPAWAGVVVGLSLVVLAVLGALLGISRLKRAQDMPKRRLASLRSNLFGLTGRGR